MQDRFTKQTFEYFDGALKNRHNKKWFDKNKELYLEHVKEPLSGLVTVLGQKISKDLPQIQMDPKKIGRPLYTSNRVTDETGIIKPQTYLYFSEKHTSRFEWNPGVYFALGAAKDDNVCGLGMYSVSSRQMSRLRDGLVHDFDAIDSILSSRSLKKRWGGLSGETYKRFPKGFDENSPAAEYLKYKQFFLGQDFTRKDLLQKDFFDRLVADFKQAMPFLQWIRKTVGVYRR